MPFSSLPISEGRVCCFLDFLNQVDYKAPTAEGIYLIYVNSRRSEPIENFCLLSKETDIKNRYDEASTKLLRPHQVKFWCNT